MPTPVLAPDYRREQAAARNLVTRTPAALVNGTTIFTVKGGFIKIVELFSLCVTVNDATASTLQWSADGDATNQTATTFTAASASLASFAAGGVAYCNFAALTTAVIITSTTGVFLSSTTATGIIVPAGIITTTVGVGSTTGTWTHYLRYHPLNPNVTVTSA